VNLPARFSHNARSAGNLAAEPRVARAIDGAHAAFADLSMIS
jgi:hypothetical protein